jgi:hypothetical protein
LDSRVGQRIQSLWTNLVWLALGKSDLTDASNGGAEGVRTPDPHNAIVVLYQLSYDPILRGLNAERAARPTIYKSNDDLSVMQAI